MKNKIMCFFSKVEVMLHMKERTWVFSCNKISFVCCQTCHVVFEGERKRKAKLRKQLCRRQIEKFNVLSGVSDTGMRSQTVKAGRMCREDRNPQDIKPSVSFQLGKSEWQMEYKASGLKRLQEMSKALLIINLIFMW